jgi:hypothetical protein
MTAPPLLALCPLGLRGALRLMHCSQWACQIASLVAAVPRWSELCRCHCSGVERSHSAVLGRLLWRRCKVRTGS